MGIHCFLNFGDICHIYSRDMGYYFQNNLGDMGYWDPFQGLSIMCGPEILVKVLLVVQSSKNYNAEFLRLFMLSNFQI